MPLSKRRRRKPKSASTGAPGARRRPFLAWLASAAVIGLAAVALFRCGDWPTRGGVPDLGDPQLVAMGEGIYAEHCASCHGADLEGEANWRTPLPSGKLRAPPHDETGHTWHHTDRQLFKVTKRGTASIAPEGYRTDMKGFAGTLSDREIWAVTAYIKSRWPDDIRARQGSMSRRAGPR